MNELPESQERKLRKMQKDYERDELEEMAWGLPKEKRNDTIKFDYL